MFIYCIHNTVSGKYYVGSTTRSCRRRWNEHRCLLAKNKHPNPRLQGAWNRYNETAFDFSILECVLREDDISIAEDYWCDHFNSVKNGYNIRISSETNRGYKHSPETIIRIREKLKGRDTMPPESRKIVAKKLRGIPKPPHVILAARNAHKIMWETRGEEMRWKCRQLSPEQIHEIRKLVDQENEILNGKRFRKGGLRYSDLGAKYGVSAATICLIVKNTRYSEV